MANFLHSKGTRNKVLSGFPTNNFGNDGDIVVVSAKGRGVYLCIKSGNRWHAANKLQDLQRLEKTSLKDLKLEKLKIGSTTITNGEYDVFSGDFTLDVAGDIELNADSGQVNIKDGTANHFLFDCDSTRFRIFDDANANDHFTIAVGAEGVTTLTTVDADTTAGHLTLAPDGDLILNPKEGKFIAQKDGTEFSAADSAYAGMILGYTRIANDGTGSGDPYISMDATLTVLQTVDASTNVSIAFVAPPSGNIEIVFSCSLYASSKTVEFALSDNSTYNEISETHTYDGGAQSSDETDINMTVVSWAVTGLTAGTSYTYYIAGAETISGTAFIKHGRFRSSGTHFPPIIVKAIALPATIVTGG